MDKLICEYKLICEIENKVILANKLIFDVGIVHSQNKSIFANSTIYYVICKERLIWEDRLICEAYLRD